MTIPEVTAYRVLNTSTAKEMTKRYVNQHVVYSILDLARTGHDVITRDTSCLCTRTLVTKVSAVHHDAAGSGARPTAADRRLAVAREAGVPEAAARATRTRVRVSHVATIVRGKQLIVL